jgi:deglycase
MAKAAFVLADDFEDSEFKVPYDKLKAAGHEVVIIGTEKGKPVKGKKGKETATIEATPDEVDPAQFEALVIPGGYSPIVDFVRKVAAADKPVAAICHAGSLLIEADLVDGRRVTSWPSIRTDLENAGARWEDAEVVQDANLITSRKPDDLDAFTNALLARL